MSETAQPRDEGRGRGGGLWGEWMGPGELSSDSAVAEIMHAKHLAPGHVSAAPVF